jgi:hypothetical protein
MNVQENGLPRRPKLSAAFGRARTDKPEIASGLSGAELRRVVAAMIG